MIAIGRRTYGNPEILTFAGNPNVMIGSYCSIANSVVFLAGGEHHPEHVSTFPFHGDGPSARPADIRIGNDVWIGHGVTVMGGITVGDGAILGARCLVRKDVPPYTIMAGIPARILRYRFTNEQIADLLRLRWWDWPENEVASYIGYLYSANIEGFLQICRERGKL